MDDDELEEVSLYEYAGGEEALHRLEEIFYSEGARGSRAEDAVHRAAAALRRPPDQVRPESFGGPDRFTRELGFQHLIHVHRHLKITDEQRERFVKLNVEALDEANLPSDERFREAVQTHTSSSAPASLSGTRGPRPMPTCIHPEGAALALTRRLKEDLMDDVSQPKRLSVNSSKRSVVARRPPPRRRL
jgi:hemoglobin